MFANNIEQTLFESKGNLPNNFDNALPAIQRDFAAESNAVRYGRRHNKNDSWPNDQSLYRDNSISFCPIIYTILFYFFTILVKNNMQILCKNDRNS